MRVHYNTPTPTNTTRTYIQPTLTHVIKTCVTFSSLSRALLKVLTPQKSNCIPYDSVTLLVLPAKKIIQDHARTWKSYTFGQGIRIGVSLLISSAFGFGFGSSWGSRSHVYYMKFETRIGYPALDGFGA